MVRPVWEEAAHWFATMRGAAPDHPLRGRFEAWLAGNPSHAAEYAAFADLWDDLRSPARCDAMADALQHRNAGLAEERRRLLKGSTVGLLLAVGGAGLAYREWRRRPEWELALHTEPGRLRREALPDGSALVLNAATDLSVRFSRAGREVLLRHGEAIFEVARDEGRPFVVDVGAARVTVLGTRFAVNRLADRVRVSVDHGTVRVTSGPFWRPQALELTAGEVAEVAVAGDQAPGLPRRVDHKAADAFAFGSGVLVFDRAGLSEIAECLTRWRRAPVRVAAGRTGADPRVTAGIQITDVEQFIDLLPRIAPVAVSREGEQVVLRAR